MHYKSIHSQSLTRWGVGVNILQTCFLEKTKVKTNMSVGQKIGNRAEGMMLS